MLNIISLQAFREKSTGPSKVAKNLISGLQEINYPFVINANLNSCPYLYILDDEKAFHTLSKVHKDITILCGPILHWKKNIPNNIGLKYHFLYPSQWLKNLGEKYSRHKQGLVRPVGINTKEFKPTSKERTKVILYFKTRNSNELRYAEKILSDQNIDYELINYDSGYQETDFKNLLQITKRVLRVGRQETQGIALQEVLSMNIPILVWDIKTVGERSPNTKYEKKSYEGDEWNEPASAAYYFDNRCGEKIFDKSELPGAIKIMKNNRNSYNPRTYIIENLDYKKQAQDLINTFKEFSRNKTSNIKPNLKLFKWRSNLFLQLGFAIFDSKQFGYLQSIIKNTYQFFNNIRQ